MTGWVVELGPHLGPGPRRAQASLCALANGTFASIGDVDLDDMATVRLTVVAGAYGPGPDRLIRPLPGPAWTTLGVVDDGDHRWVLDLRSGTLTRQPIGDGLRVVRFVALARAGVGALRAEVPGDSDWAGSLSWPVAPASLAAMHWWARWSDDGDLHAETGSARTTVLVAARQHVEVGEGSSRLERIVSLAHGAPPPRDEIDRALDDACEIGFDGLLAEQRAAWADLWDDADIEIEGDPTAQLAIRFALFHVLTSAATQGEAAVGARGLTGLAYAGHVFWDTDVYVLPVLAATRPDAARAVLEYRIRRLPAARSAAAARALPGARFPWESADDGVDVTPRTAIDLDGRAFPIRTGELAEHINSDVAWAALHYTDWTGDDALLAGPGRPLVTETAQYLLARTRTDADGRRHLDDVIGPDEYHEGVDDNAFTNVMARWHLRQAASLLREDGEVATAAALEDGAATLVDGFDPASRRHQQFTGVWALEPLRLSDLAEPPVAADVLLGRERVAASRVLKQPDVLMLHHLLGDELPAGSLAADVDDELPHIAHGSSLSPAICASVLARAGRPDDAMEWFDLAARIDLDDLTYQTATGLHLATMGGLWQAVVFGFAGIRPTASGLRIDPHLPTRWTSVRVRLRYRGAAVRVHVDHDGVAVDATEPVPVIIAGEIAQTPVHRSRRPVVGRSTT